MKKCFTLVALLLIVGWATVVAQTVNVTFKVNMKRAAKTGYFNPVTDVVTIPGGFNNWLNTPPANIEKKLEDPDGDSIYTKTIPLTDAQYEYKYNIGLGWDGKDELGGQPNRKVNKPAADSVLAPVWFDNASGDTVSVTFNVNMKLPAKGIPNFSTRKVYVAGDFNGFTTWSDGAIQMTDPDNDSIFTVTTPAFSGNIKYKFIHSTGAASAGSWETIADRKTWVPGRAVTISKLWNDQTPVPLANGNIFFEVNMSVAAELGVYNPNVDSVQIRGSFNGWNASEPSKSLLIQDPGNPNSWYLDVPFVNSPVGDTSYYKFFLKNPSSGFQYANGGWEVPLSKSPNGDRNRPIPFLGSPTQTAQIAFYDGVHTDWVVPTGTSVQTEFSVDMTPATLASVQGTNPVFRPGIDTVYWIPRHPMFFAVRGLPWPGNQPRILSLLDPDGDKIYKGTLTLNGPNFNGFLYQYAYTTPTVGLVQEDGNQGQARVRFVRQTAPRTFTSPWTMPQDIWTNGEKPEEESPLTSIKEIDGGLLNSFSLEQNYPNPFNPTTTIRFTIPDAGNVNLALYNLLGEKVGEILNQEMKPGSFEFSFNASNLSSGVYFYTIKTGNYAASKKMMLMK